MTRTIFTLLPLAFASLPSPALAARSAATYPAYLPSELSSLPQGTLLRGTADVSDLSPYGQGLTYSTIAVTELPFDKALRIKVPTTAPFAWDAGLRLTIPKAVAKGDAALLCFWSRLEQITDESGEGRLDVLVERSGGDYEKSLSRSMGVTSQWRRSCHAFTFSSAFDSAGTHLGFNFGHRPQTLELGGIDLVFFEKQVTIDQLKPFSMRDTYSGREPGAAWRTAAADRIDSLRKAPLSVTVLKDGRPLAGAQVRVKMRRHAFPFGTAVAANRISNQTSLVNRTYFDTLQTLFNHAVLENHLKWAYWSPTQAIVADSAVSRLRAQGLTVRGHVLVWPSWRNMPAWVSKTDPTLLHQQINSHIDSMTQRYQGQLIDWDVLNEPYDNRDAMDLIGEQAMGDWFRRAHAGDSIARLYINDYAILAGDNAGQRANYFRIIRKLLDEKAPLHGIGVQGHFGFSPTGIEEVLRRMDTLGTFGLPVKVTEFDVDTDDEELQAEYTRDFMTAFFSHPAAGGFLMWGFWENAHWRAQAAMYRADWTPKPNAHAYRKLVFKDWWTDTTGVSSADGGVALRGFLGDYVLEIEGDGLKREVPVSLSTDTKLSVDLATGVITSGLRSQGSKRDIGFRRIAKNGRLVLEITAGASGNGIGSRSPINARLLNLSGRELGRWSSAGEGPLVISPASLPGMAVLEAVSGSTMARFLVAP